MGFDATPLDYNFPAQPRVPLAAAAGPLPTDAASLLGQPVAQPPYMLPTSVDDLIRPQATSNPGFYPGSFIPTTRTNDSGDLLKLLKTVPSAVTPYREAHPNNQLLKMVENGKDAEILRTMNLMKQDLFANLSAQDKKDLESGKVPDSVLNSFKWNYSALATDPLTGSFDEDLAKKIILATGKMSAGQFLSNLSIIAQRDQMAMQKMTSQQMWVAALLEDLRASIPFSKSAHVT